MWTRQALSCELRKQRPLNQAVAHHREIDMSLMGTLAKAAVGIAVAKGAQTVLSRAGGGSGTGLQDMLGQVLGGGQSPSSSASDQGGAAGGLSGGLGQLLESLQQSNPRTQSGGLDGLLGSLGGSQGSGQSGGQLGGLLGQLAGQLGGASGASGGGLGGLGGLLGGLATSAGGGGNFGDLLNQAMRNGGEPDTSPKAEQDVAAALLLKAMIQAAKSDGDLDGAERDKLMKHLGDISADERAFVEAEFARPVDAKGLARSVPQGLEPQVYLMSILAIDLDNRNEANYLHELASEMGLERDMVNAIHSQVGAPALYS
jgi:uncharacterized membrane protein YebE (DUF533 family)